MPALLDALRAGAPFALLVLSGLCAAAVFWSQHRQHKARATTQNPFGHWPRGTPPRSSRSAASSLDMMSRRIPLGPAAGAACGGVLCKEDR